MKNVVSKLFVGVLALFCCSAGMAATVTVTPSTATPSVGDTFTVTISGSGFLADADPNVDQTSIGGTLGLEITGGISYVSGALPASGPFSGGANGGSYTPHPPSGTPLTFDITTAVGASGSFDALVLTFHADSAGPAGINLLDDQNFLAWFQFNDPFGPIPVTYIQGSLTVQCSGPCITVTDAVPPVDDQTVPFGDVQVGQASTQTVTITNNGTANLVLGTLGQTNPDPLAAPFSLVNDTCSGQTLAATASCTVDVRYAPTAAGAASDSFDIPSNDPNSPSVVVALTGTGTIPAIVVTDSVAPATDQDVGFGLVSVSTQSTQTVTVTNGGTAILNVGAVASVDPLAAPFSIANDGCSNQALNPAASCHFDIQFMPLTTDPFSDHLDIPSDDPNTPTVTVNVSGTGNIATTPDIAVSDSVPPADDQLMDFGSVTVSQTSTETVTVTNNGDGDLNIAAITLTTGAPFSIANDNCSNTAVTPTNTCTFDVQFQPSALVGSNDTVHVPSNDPDTPVADVTVSGTGESVPTPDIEVTDSVQPADDLELPFGSIEEHTTSQQTVTVTNKGNDILNIMGVATGDPLAAPFSIVTDGCTGLALAEDESCTITLEFAAGVPADPVSNDSFDIESDDPDEGTVTVDVHGSAQPGIRSNSPGDSALDPLTLLGLGLFGYAAKRRRRARV